MKRILVFLLICLTAMALVSCDAESLSKFGQMASKTGNNVFGLKPNMEQVNAATGKLSDSVIVDDGGNVTLSFSEAAKISDDIQEIKSSPKKTEELKAQLEQPITTDPEQAEQIKVQLKDEIQGKLDVVDSIVGSVDDELKPVVEAVSQVLSDILEGIGDQPTKGDLATVAVIADLTTSVADMISEGVNLETEEGLQSVFEIVGKASNTIETLKITSESAGLDILSQIGSVIGGFLGGSDGAEV